jgi:hypothetical protein
MGVKKKLSDLNKDKREGLRIKDVVNEKLEKRRRMKK